MISRVLPVRGRLDPIVLGCAIALSALGVLFIASTAGGGRFQGLASRQALWIAVGLGGMFAAVLMDYRTLLKVSFALYLASLLPLIYLLVFGQRIANVRSWIRFGSFQFQPAELAKIATALLVAYLFENEDENRLRLSAFVKLGAIVGVPFVLVFAQPDLGLALTFLPLLLVGFFFGRLPLKGWIAILIAVAVLGGAGWLFLKGYQKERIETFLNPDRDVLKGGYQVRQSKIAVGSGGFSGKGLHAGTQSQLRFLPVQHTDFILAVIAEEWGFLGVIARPGALRRASPAMFDARAGCARPRRRVPDPGALRDDVLFRHGQRLDDDRTASDDGNPAPARLLWRVFDRHDALRDRLDSGRGLPALRERVRYELLVNATPPETRVAATEDGRTVEVLHERRGHQGLVGNVYLGRVHRILPGMHAAFVSLGLERDAFLYVEDILPRAVETEEEEVEARSGGAPDAARIEDLLREGQDVVVQVTKDPLSGKGPRVTANIALPGRDARLSSRRARGRRLAAHHGGRGARAAPADPGGASGRVLRWIARTAARGGAPPRFLADKSYLEDLAGRIARGAKRRAGPLLLHRELDLALRVACATS